MECIWIPNSLLMRLYDLWSSQTLDDRVFERDYFSMNPSRLSLLRKWRTRIWHLLKKSRSYRSILRAKYLLIAGASFVEINCAIIAGFKRTFNWKCLQTGAWNSDRSYNLDKNWDRTQRILICHFIYFLYVWIIRIFSDIFVPDIRQSGSNNAAAI